RPIASRAVRLKAAGSGLLKYQLCASPPVFTSCVAAPGDAGSVLLKYQLCASPPVFTSCVAAPGVQGPVPPPPSPPHASTSSPAPSAGSPPQRKNVITRLRLPVRV